MGGPCLLDSAGTGIEIAGKFYIYAPACTDNFQASGGGGGSGALQPTQLCSGCHIGLRV
jgi:hypothetical protein